MPTKLSKIIYPTCNGTLIGETFIHCEQIQASERGLQQNVALTNQETCIWHANFQWVWCT